MHKIALVTLGCPKNQVDSDDLAYKISSAGLVITDNAEEADTFIINTCCFIDDAKKESIETILDLSSHKKDDARLIVMGCMGQKYRKDIEEDLPEVDRVFGVQDHDKVINYLRSRIGSADFSEVSTLKHAQSFEYVKIADGCNRTCSFCVIPSIRGRFRSIERDSIIEKAKRHISTGAKELILIAQDITGYGRDATGSLRDLVNEISQVNGDFRLRLLYLYPTGITNELISTIRDNDRVCSYFDIPFQHIHNDILKAMSRAYTSDQVREIIYKIKKEIPNAALRTTLITGFPGEENEHHEALMNFVKETEFDRLGVFKYSPQEDTASAKMKGQVPDHIKDERFDEIMSLQAGISYELNKKLKGEVFSALVDDIDEGTGIARLESQAPEIDGAVMIDECPEKLKGEFINVRINEAYEYDLKGEIANE
ncbi:MAG: 30S ribosomal protein S12 methylthiotransferase RimO [Nitrospirota bacterium]|nr:MAG: 30S ribosomal protein S12 methylthiotransferase RimO [Nitrospirota bacterium]